MTPLTGVVLVGGASRRFGTSKANARFRGETLGQRATRLLAEVCDEVLVVGKVGDGLPFTVVDDGSDARAPVHGVIAGLRRAGHDDVVVLPVDVPLVTPGALGALGEAGAVPPIGSPCPAVSACAPSGAGGARCRRRAVASWRQPGDAGAAGGAARRRRHARGARRSGAAWPCARRRRHRHARARYARAGGAGACRDVGRAAADGFRAAGDLARRSTIGTATRLGRHWPARRGRAGRSSSQFAGSTPTHPTRRASWRTRLPPCARLFQVFGTRVWPLADVRSTSPTGRCCSARSTGAGSRTRRSPQACSRRWTPTGRCGCVGRRARVDWPHRDGRSSHEGSPHHAARARRRRAAPGDLGRGARPRAAGLRARARGATRRRRSGSSRARRRRTR